MRNSRFILMICLLLPLLAGCDLFRKMAGRPTSAQIEQKREMIEAEMAAHQSRLDSLDAVQKQISDSLAVLDSMRFSDDALVEARQLADVSRNSLAFRYYVIVGAFGNRGNAEKYAEEMNTKGMPAVLISYVNGFTAVGVCPTDNITEAYASLRRVRESASCPDAWILDNR